MHWNEYIKMLHTYSKEREEIKHQEGSAHGFKLFWNGLEQLVQSQF